MEEIVNDPFKAGQEYDWAKAYWFYDSLKTFYVAFYIAGGGFMVYDLDSSDFKTLLVNMLTVNSGEFPNKQRIESAIEEFKGKAVKQSHCHNVHLRTAPYGDGDGVVIDLLNDSCTAAIVTPGKVEIGAPGCFFRRTASMQSLPEPNLNGNLMDLFKFVPIISEQDRKVLIVWVVASLMISDSYSILALQGVQGSTKSSAARFIKALIDPNLVALTPMSTSERDIMIAAQNSRIIAFDNLRTLKPAISDLLCGLSTGSGFRTRKLYTDVDEITIKVCVPVILTGIHSLIIEADLLDRALIISMPSVSKKDRKSLKMINAEFEKARPGIFGGLLTCLSKVLEILPSVVLEESPRMADFARVGVAVEGALGWPEGSFLEAYSGKIDDAIGSVIADDVTAQSIISLLDLEGSWMGTAANLIKALSRYDSGVTKTPRVISAKLRSMAPGLERLGIKCEFDINKGKVRRAIRLKRKVEGVDALETVDSGGMTVKAEVESVDSLETVDSTEMVVKPEVEITHIPPSISVAAEEALSEVLDDLDSFEEHDDHASPDLNEFRMDASGYTDN